ncbi:MAG: CinA family protein [Burkholderiales bacterium]|nr:CinA family protein [Burkholderiales bacterium]
MPPADLIALAADVAEQLLARGWRLATAESCTGGLIAATCTELSGSSQWLDRGWVTYSNAAKTDLLGVDAGLIEDHGAVSEAVARAMAEGALQRSTAEVAVAVTGIAGPTGGSPDKPVGTVWLAWAVQGSLTQALRCHFDGDRAAVRHATVAQALRGVLLGVLNTAPPRTP